MAIKEVNRDLCIRCQAKPLLICASRLGAKTSINKNSLSLSTRVVTARRWLTLLPSTVLPAVARSGNSYWLSRLGRSLPQILQIVERFMHKDIRLVALKESMRFEGKHNLQTKAMIALFGLFAEVERDLIAERTKEGLAAAKAKGTRLGRPKGALGKSKLDGKEAEITLLLQKKVSKASLARIVEVSPMTLDHFIRTRKLQPSTPQRG